MASLLNRAKMGTSTTGTGTVTLGSAETGYLTLAEAGAVNATSYAYLLEDGDDFEFGNGTYTSSGTTFSRDTVTASKIAGVAGTTKLTLSGSATLAIVPRVADIVGVAGALGTPSSGTLTNCSGLPVSGIEASTSAPLGVGSLEIGHASDTTLDRAAAGALQVEGKRLLTPAAQSDMESESSTVLGVVPGRAHFAPSAVKSWINFNGTGTPAIRVSRNGSSITDNGTGDWTANWTTSFSSGDYAVGAFGRDNDSEARAVISQDGSAHMAAGSLRVVATGNSSTKFDSDRVTLLCSGDF